MSTKTTFKRIALVAVAALGLGVFSVAPAANAGGLDDTLTLSASSASINVGETATVTATFTFTSQLANGTRMTDSGVVWVAGVGAGGNVVSRPTQDTANAVTYTYGKAIPAAIATGDANGRGTVGGETTTATTAGTSFTHTSDSAVAKIDGAYTKAAYTILFQNVTTAGTYIYTISTRDIANKFLYKTATFTLTVSAPTSGQVGDYTKSKVYLNRLAEYNGAAYKVFAAGENPSFYTDLRADSSLTVSTGTAAIPNAVAVLWPIVNNSSDTKIANAGTLARVMDSVTVTVTGPGLLATASQYTGVGTTLTKQTTMNYNESIVVYSDGTPGSTTFTTYLGNAVNANYIIGTKSMIFSGKATTFTPTAVNDSAGNVKYLSAADSSVAAITFIAKDAASNLVSSAALNINQGTGAFYAISSDTKVIAAGYTTALRTDPRLSCSYTSASVGWTCSGYVFDTGTVTLTITDSYTQTSGGNITTDTTSAPTKSSAVSITFAGKAATTTIAFDKTTYLPGEKAMLTVTSKDSEGRAVGDGAQAVFASLSWASTAPTFVTNTAAEAAGGTFTSLTTYLTDGTSNSFFKGTDTAMVFMPTVAGTYTLQGVSANNLGSKAVATILTFTVADPTKDAADAATDAALEATDAAYAAQDAAQLAAEAADAATAAAEAATAAVEDLATQVASLFADLQKQITTLANVVAKIAKKVKA